MSQSFDEPSPLALPPASNSRRVLLVVFAVIVMAFCVVVIYLYRQINAVRDYAPPVPRPVKNAPYIPTPQAVVDEMLKQARVTQDDVVYDLGCGDGRIVITAAKEFGCRAVGYEIDPELVALARKQAREAGVEDLVTIEQQDIFTVDLRDASVVMLYLLPAMNEKLVPQLLKLKPGARIVCHDFAIQGYKPDRRTTLSLEDSGEHLIHVWERPLGETAAPEESMGFGVRKK